MAELNDVFGKMSISEIHDAFDRQAFSPSQLTQAFLGRIEKSNLGAYLTVCGERALAQAHLADEIIKEKGKAPRDQLPLFGIPLGIKDILTIDQVRTTCASKMLENYVPPYTATSVQRLESAGAITLGKLNLDEFAMGSGNENSAFGPVQHPTHPGYVPGGSSGGSAAAVKAGLCVASLGTDTGGSIRLPASYCGIVGIKPTYGRISRYGQVAFASSLDQIGPMTLHVEDAAILLDVMSGYDPYDSTSSQTSQSDRVHFQASKKEPDWKSMKFGVPEEYFIGGLSADVERSISESIRWFEAQGAKKVSVSLPHTKFAVAVYYILAVSEASSNLARFDGIRFGTRPKEAMEAKSLSEFYQKVRSQFGSEVKRRIILGTFALSSGYSDAYFKRACQVRRRIKEDFDSAFQEVDFIVGPVAPTTAFKMAQKDTDPLRLYLNDIFTIPANLAGLPAMSVPCGEDHQGLPIGLHLMAPPFQEERLISISSFFSKKTGRNHS